MIRKDGQTFAFIPAQHIENRVLDEAMLELKISERLVRCGLHEYSATERIAASVLLRSGRYEGEDE